MSFVTHLEDEIKALVTKAEAAISPEVKAIDAYIKANIGPDVMLLAKALIAGFIAGSPWAPLEAALVTQAAGIGKTLIEGAATVALNVAQSQQIAITAPIAAAS